MCTGITYVSEMQGIIGQIFLNVQPTGGCSAHCEDEAEVTVVNSLLGAEPGGDWPLSWN